MTRGCARTTLGDLTVYSRPTNPTLFASMQSKCRYGSTRVATISHTINPAVTTIQRPRTLTTVRTNSFFRYEMLSLLLKTPVGTIVVKTKNRCRPPQCVETDGSASYGVRPSQHLLVTTACLRCHRRPRNAEDTMDASAGSLGIYRVPQLRPLRKKEVNPAPSDSLQ